MPIGGNRNRSKVDDAISVYEETMGRQLGFGKAIEASTVHDALKRRAWAKPWSIDRAKGVRKIRNNARHFAGYAFGKQRAESDISYIAKTLEEFGNPQAAAQVRKILAPRRALHPGKWQRGPSTSQPQRATIEPTYVGILIVLAIAAAIVFQCGWSPFGDSYETNAAPAPVDQPASINEKAPTSEPITVPQDKQVRLEKETTSIHDMLPGTCQQTAVGNTVCIGNPEGQPELPPHLPDDGHPLQSNICLTVGTENVCWDWIQDTPTGVQFLDIRKGNSHACGIKTDQNIICWGANVTNLLDAPPGEFVALTTGFMHSCALRHNGTAECWGDNSFGQLAAPPNQFKEISAGSTSTCGIDYDNALVCWGNESQYRSAPIGTDKLTKVSSGYSHACGLQNDRTPICWGGYEPENNIAPAVKLVSINAGDQNTCGIMTDGNAVCWGKNQSSGTEIPPGRFTDIQTDGSTTCGLRPDGSIECWGWALALDYSQRTPPGPYRTFRINGATCGIRFDDTASCWHTEQFTSKALNEQTQTTATPTKIVGGVGIETGNYFAECEPHGYVTIQNPHSFNKTFGNTTVTITDGAEVTISECELTKEY